jgi:osmotically-inducible protein OsmY
MVAGCERQEAPDYEARVNDNLKNAKLGDVNADWKDEEKQLVLSGEVQNAADKARAEELAQQVVGTTGRVVNEVKVEGTNVEAVDDRIEDELGRAFKEDNEWDLDGLDLNFDSEAGVVTITGDAPSQAVKDRVTARVKQIAGVKDVVNNLEVKPTKR